MNNDNLSFSTGFARSAFDSDCQVRKTNEAMCSVDDHTILSHEVQPFNWSVKFFNMTKYSAEVWSPISN